MQLEEAERCLNCAQCSECMECVSACEKKAIDHSMNEEKIELEVGAVILTPGFDEFDAEQKGEYGFNRYPNVLTSVQFERMLSAAGPSQWPCRAQGQWQRCQTDSLDSMCGFPRIKTRKRILLIYMLYGDNKTGNDCFRAS